jgi:hypothetical protein
MHGVSRKGIGWMEQSGLGGGNMSYLTRNIRKYKRSIL